MVSFLTHWLVLAIALLVTTYVVGGVSVDSYTSLAVAALVIGFVNALVRPILVLLSLPLTILTLGLFYLVVNGACFMLAAWLVNGFDVTSWWAAIFGALVMSIVGWLINSIIAPPRPADR
jgi:putative membrane protein